MQLRISLFGLPTAQWVQADAANNPAINAPSAQRVKLTRAVESLLMYLLVQRRNTHTRESLIGVFWGEQADEQARGCLSTALWRLRRTLEPDPALHGQILLTTPQGAVGILRSDKVWLDVEAFEDAAQPLLAKPAQTLTPTTAQQLKRAVGIYSGPLLEGFYDDWALRERERLHAMYINSMAYLMRYYHQQADYAEAIVYAQSILEQDSLREDVHRTLMRLFHENGQRTQAMQQYEQCRQLLRQELGIEPMPETQALCHNISQNTLYATQPQNGGAKNIQKNSDERACAVRPEKSVYHQLKCALSELDSLRQRLQGALDYLDS